MKLIDFKTLPSSLSMPENGVISFEESVYLNGNNAVDTVEITFLCDPPNWQMTSPAQRTFPVSTSGFHKFADAISFQLKPGGVKVPQIIPVFCYAHLTSNTMSPLALYFSVVVK